ncbi:MAG: small basic protein [Candidatus Omnitrophica bacterium]|nr:small basic protein [Candidatus Omnitrophota bacterium]
MSIHPSLSFSDKDKKSRSVLKRIERLKIMMEKGLWKEGDSVFGLPKIKTVKIKVKKERPKEAAEATQATSEAAETKEQSSIASPVSKDQAKK